MDTAAPRRLKGKAPDMGDEVRAALELRPNTAEARRASGRARNLLLARACLDTEESAEEVISILKGLMQPANFADDDSLSDFLHEVAHLVFALSRRGGVLATSLAHEIGADPREVLEDMERYLPDDQV